MGWAISLILVFLCAVAAAVYAELDREKKSEKEFDKWLLQLRDGHDLDLEQAILQAIKHSRFRRISKKSSKAAYDLALDNLAAIPHNHAAKEFVIEIGRWHLARLRGTKKAAPADNETIQRDILTRCRMMVRPNEKAASWVERSPLR